MIIIVVLQYLSYFGTASDLERRDRNGSVKKLCCTEAINR
jgi:hypothetical protein